MAKRCVFFVLWIQIKRQQRTRSDTAGIDRGDRSDKKEHCNLDDHDVRTALATC